MAREEGMKILVGGDEFLDIFLLFAGYRKTFGFMIDLLSFSLKSLGPRQEGYSLH